MNQIQSYWSLVLIVLIILTIITDIPTSGLITAFMVAINSLMKHRSCKNKNKGTSSPQPAPSPSPPQPEQPEVSNGVMEYNKRIIDSIMSCPSNKHIKENVCLDDKLLQQSIRSAEKSKKSIDIRSHWNNNNWKKYYEHELGVHAVDNREWWNTDF